MAESRDQMPESHGQMPDSDDQMPDSAMFTIGSSQLASSQMGSASLSMKYGASARVVATPRNRGHALAVWEHQTYTSTGQRI